MAKRLPPLMGMDVGKPMLYHPYQQEFLRVRRLRVCPVCHQVGSTGDDGLLHCCGKDLHDAQRLYKRLGLFAGRRGAKSVSGAHGVVEELLIPNTLGWVCGPTYEILHDATMPTLLKLIPREWGLHWDAEHLILTLVNGARVAFRSLDDPDRAHAGVGLHWAWLDEAAFIAELAWDYLEPALADFRGVAYFTSSVDGFDWTYERIEKKAFLEHVPGFWAAKWTTSDNPAIPREEIEQARKTKPPAIFRQEYEASRENFTGSVYGDYIDAAWLPDDAAVKKVIPEWPDIHPDRKIIVGLDSGADHPFGAVAMVVTERAIVVIGEYLERQRAVSQHLPAIKAMMRNRFSPDNPVLWAANRNEANMRLEFAAQGIGVAMAENDQMSGIQRVLSWLYTGRLKIAYCCPKTFEQMKQLRFADNVSKNKEKKQEKVFKLNDELPDCVRYGLMTWPHLPEPLMEIVERQLDARTSWELAKMKKYSNRDNERELQPAEGRYPTGDFYGHEGNDDLVGDDSFYGW